MNGSDSTGSGGNDVGNTSLLDRWHIARELIKHEDGLYHQRLSSLLTLHGFLFAAVAVVVSVATSEDHQAYSLFLFIFVLAVCWVGYRTACRVHDPLQAARQQVAVVALWWTWTAGGENVSPCDNAGCRSYQSHFPPIIGGDEYYNRYNQDLIKASKQEQDKTSDKFQPLERFLKWVWRAIFVVMFIMGGICFMSIQLQSYDRCIQSLTAPATAVANDTHSNGWLQRARCFLMPQPQARAAKLQASNGTGQAGCVGTQPQQ